MGKLLVDVDREALERVRVKLGARSGAEAIRRLIAEADDGHLMLKTEGLVSDFDTSRAKVTNPGKTKAPYGSRLKKR